MKKILIGLAGLTFTAAIALGVYTHQTRITDSTLLANIAALSNDEDDGYSESLGTVEVDVVSVRCRKKRRSECNVAIETADGTAHAHIVIKNYENF